MFPILLKKFLESVPQTSCSALHAMLWSAKAAEMNCRGFIYVSRRRHAFTGRVLPEVNSQQWLPSWVRPAEVEGPVIEVTSPRDLQRLGASSWQESYGTFKVI